MDVDSIVLDLVRCCLTVRTALRGLVARHRILRFPIVHRIDGKERERKIWVLFSEVFHLLQGIYFFLHPFELSSSVFLGLVFVAYPAMFVSQFGKSVFYSYLT